MSENESVHDAALPNRRKYHPLQSLLLWDIMQDRESRPIFYWFAGTLVFGMLIYHWLEGWAYLDALYFSLITMATIGYGDLVPSTQIAKLFTMFFAVNGIAILFSFFDRIRAVRATHYNEKKPPLGDEDEP